MICSERQVEYEGGLLQNIEHRTQNFLLCCIVINKFKWSLQIHTDGDMFSCRAADFAHLSDDELNFFFLLHSF